MNPKALPLTMALACTGVASAPAALAAEEPRYYGGETIVVTASRTAQPISAALQAVTVISSEDIRQSGRQTLPEVLQRLGGVEISSTGGAGQTSAVFMRGANSAHTLVLVDGLRVGSATSGTTAFENIPLEQIDRIEIVAGPTSSLYGSDAIGGVIQIFTKGGGAASHASVSAGTGTYRTNAVDAALDRTFGDASLSLAAGYSQSDQFDATKPSLAFDQHNPDRDPYRNANASARLAYRFAPGQDAGASVFYSEGNTHYDSGPATDDVNHQKLTTYAAYSRNALAPWWESFVRIGRGIDDIVAIGALPGHFRSDQDQATWQNTFPMLGGTLVAGAEYLRQKVHSDTAYERTSRTIGSGFAGFSGAYGAHALQANVRYDDNNQFGAHTTGSLAYGYRIAEGLRLRASAGTAFHAPTFNDLYFPSFGNPDLKAERSKSGEVGLVWEDRGVRSGARPSARGEGAESRGAGEGSAFQRTAAGGALERSNESGASAPANEGGAAQRSDEGGALQRLNEGGASQRLSATYFENRITDLIVFDLGTFLPQNLAKARIRGGEFEYQGTLYGTSVGARLTLQQPEEQSTGLRLPRRARTFGNVRASRTWGQWTFGAEVVASGARFDSSSEDPATRMGGYALLNLLATYRWAPQWSAELRWDNVANKDYELAKGYNTPGSNVFVTLRWASSP